MGKPRRGKKGGKSAAGAKGAEDSADVSPAEAHKQRGNELFAIAEFHAAIAEYTKAIALDPTVPAFFSNRSAAYAAIGTVKACREALRDADECLRLSPDWPKGYFRKGRALEGLGQYRLAKSFLEKGQELNPSSPDFAAALESLAKMGITDKGAEIEKEALPLDDAGSATGVAGAGGASAAGGAAGGATGGAASGGEVALRVAEEEDKFEQLEKWLLDNGGHFPYLYMKRYSDNYRGVHVRVQVPRNQELMAIPGNCLITVEMGKECSTGKLMQEYKVDVSAEKHCYVSVFVLIDRLNPDSHFQPFYRILPTAYPSMPIFWSEDKLKWLEGSYLLQQISDRKRNIKADFEEICRADPTFSRFTLEEFSWARMMVASRNFGINFRGTKTDALVPLADMLNHYRPRETKWTYDNDKDAFTITSLARLSAGQQVYDSYGKKCNSRFLLNYGFAVEVNRDTDGQCHNEVRLLFKALRPEEDRWYDSRLALFGGFSQSRGIRVSTWYEHSSTQEAFSYLRFTLAQGPEEMLYLPQMSAEYDLVKNPIFPVSIECEIRVLNALANLMKAQLARYPTTLEEDLKTLEDGVYPFGSDRRNALVIIKGEKEVCHHYIELARIVPPLLRGEWRDVKRTLAKEYVGVTDVNKYVNSVVPYLMRRKGAHK